MSMLSATLLRLEGKSPAQAPPATCPARCSSYPPSPTNEIKGGAQSSSLLEGAMVAIFEKGTLPIQGRGFFPHFQMSLRFKRASPAAIFVLGREA